MLNGSLWSKCPVKLFICSKIRPVPFTSGASMSQRTALHVIVNGGDWLWSPANIKGANKDAKIYVRRSTTLHNLLFCVHTLCMNYVTSTFLLVSSVVHDYDLLLQLFHVLWSTWTRFIWYRSSSAQTSLNNYRILSKPRYYVNSDILVKLYYALIYPFLTYGLISWGNTYSSTTQPLFILQKRAMRMMTFSELNFVSILV